VQDPTITLAILSKMAQKPEITFDNLYVKLYNKELWLLAYQSIAPKPGNMTAGTDNQTIDGTSMALIEELIADLKASRYKPTPARREYIPKANGKMRPLGIPSFRDKLVQTALKLILEAIYEPTFSSYSHGFRPEKSCHTALMQVKKLTGIRWWVEGDIKGFFDNLDHDTLLRTLRKRITDNRFLHIIQQLLAAGYIEDWQYHKTYSGTPQGGNLSPLLSNIYLHELDQAMAKKIAEFNRGTYREKRPEYECVHTQITNARKKARQTGEWTAYKALKNKQLSMQACDPQDPNYRRLYYVRYADDFLIGVIGSKQDAQLLKIWLGDYLRNELGLELSDEKTLITNAKRRVRFLGYDIKRWDGRTKKKKFQTNYGVVSKKRTTTHHLALLMPRDKCQSFAKEYGDPIKWHGERRSHLLHLSELEILHIYNAEIQGFLGYYSLADNLKTVAARFLWLTTTSFLRTLAGKRQSTLMKVACSLKHGPARYVVPLEKDGKVIKEYVLIASTKQLRTKKTTYGNVDQIPVTLKYRSRTELGARLLAHTCEWCGTTEGKIEVHHIRKLRDLKGKTPWERQMIERKRKTMVLCEDCHDKLHAGTLSEKTKAK
jgi:group II intron reverse transcriptase/maturase